MRSVCVQEPAPEAGVPPFIVASPHDFEDVRLAQRPLKLDELRFRYEFNKSVSKSLLSSLAQCCRPPQEEMLTRPGCPATSLPFGSLAYPPNLDHLQAFITAVIMWKCFEEIKPQRNGRALTDECGRGPEATAGTSAALLPCCGRLPWPCRGPGRPGR